MERSNQASHNTASSLSAPAEEGLTTAVGTHPYFIFSGSDFNAEDDSETSTKRFLCADLARNDYDRSEDNNARPEMDNQGVFTALDGAISAACVECAQDGVWRAIAELQQVATGPGGTVGIFEIVGTVYSGPQGRAVFKAFFTH